MKKVFSLAFLFTTIVNTYSQESLRGIGSFKVGETTTSGIVDFAKKENIKVKQSNSLMDTYGTYVSGKKTSKIYLLSKSGKDNVISDPQYSDHPLVKTYFIDYYEVSDVPIRKLYLKFYNDTLYDLECDFSKELREALTLKYGAGVDSVAKKSVKCRSRMTGDFEEDETSYYTKWLNGSNGMISISCVGHYFDYKCEKKYLSYFFIKNSNVSKQVISEEVDKREKEKAEQEKGKKGKLTDF